MRIATFFVPSICLAPCILALIVGSWLSRPDLYAATAPQSQISDGTVILLFTEADLQKLIAEGFRERGKQQGLFLTNMSFDWEAFSRPAGATTSGYRIAVYTPLAWIRQQASDAAKEYRTFVVTDVTQDMLRPILRITAYPDVPERVTASGMIGSSSVQHVVLRDTGRKRTMQPLTKETFVETVKNAMGGSADFAGVRATFDLNALAELRALDPKGEFLVTVVGGAGEDKDFKIKEKHLKDLPE